MGDQALLKLFSLMIMDIDTVSIDYDSRQLYLVGDN